MNGKAKANIAGIMLLFCLLFVLVYTVQAALSGYDLAWWTVDGGGGSSQGGSYSLKGTTGQADAGRLKGGSYTLEGGFWTGSPLTTDELKYQVLLPAIIK